MLLFEFIIHKIKEMGILQAYKSFIPLFVAFHIRRYGKTINELLTYVLSRFYGLGLLQGKGRYPAGTLLRYVNLIY